MSSKTLALALAALGALLSWAPAAAADGLDAPDDALCDKGVCFDRCGGLAARLTSGFLVCVEKDGQVVWVGVYDSEGRNCALIVGVPVPAPTGLP